MVGALNPKIPKINETVWVHKPPQFKYISCSGIHYDTWEILSHDPSQNQTHNLFWMMLTSSWLWCQHTTRKSTLAMQSNGPLPQVKLATWVPNDDSATLPTSLYRNTSWNEAVSHVLMTQELNGPTLCFSSSASIVICIFRMFGWYTKSSLSEWQRMTAAEYEWQVDAVQPIISTCHGWLGHVEHNFETYPCYCHAIL